MGRTLYTAAYYIIYKPMSQVIPQQDEEDDVNGNRIDKTRTLYT